MLRRKLLLSCYSLGETEGSAPSTELSFRRSAPRAQSAGLGNESGYAIPKLQIPRPFKLYVFNPFNPLNAFNPARC